MAAADPVVTTDMLEARLAVLEAGSGGGSGGSQDPLDRAAAKAVKAERKSLQAALNGRDAAAKEALLMRKVLEMTGKHARAAKQLRTVEDERDSLVHQKEEKRSNEHVQVQTCLAVVKSFLSLSIASLCVSLVV